MVPQKDPDSQDVQERDKRQQIQTKELPIRYEVKNFFPLRIEIQQTFLPVAHSPRQSLQALPKIYQLLA